MKKLLSSGLLSLFVLGSFVIPAGASPVYQAPNAGNMDFYPMMQRQMEKEETLDFVNNPENYKKKRKSKNDDNQLKDIKFDPNYTPNYGGSYLRRSRPAFMRFTKDKDGNIRIQEVNSTDEKNINNGTQE